jgi:hypothetical protein
MQYIFTIMEKEEELVNLNKYKQMKKLILMLVLVLTMVSCMAQNITDPLKRGHAIGKVIEKTETTAIVTTQGRSLIVNGDLEVGIEYDLVYDIIQTRPDGTLVVNLVASTHSDRQNAISRARLLTLIKR